MYFLQGNVPLRHLLNEEILFTSWWRSAFNDVNDWALYTLIFRYLCKINYIQGGNPSEIPFRRALKKVIMEVYLKSSWRRKVHLNKRRRNLGRRFFTAQKAPVANIWGPINVMNYLKRLSHRCKIVRILLPQHYFIPLGDGSALAQGSQFRNWGSLYF